MPAVSSQSLNDPAGSPEELERLIDQALDSISSLIPYELASILELEGDTLRVRTARGPLASEAVRRHELDLEDFPSLRRSLETRRPLAFREHDHHEEGDPYDGVLDLRHGHSCMVVPLYARDRSLGLMTFDRQVCEPYSAEVLELAAVYGQLIALAVYLVQQARGLRASQASLQERNRLLRIDAQGPGKAADKLLSSRSPSMRALAARARIMAESDSPVLITGETGVGKEVLAQAIHDWSPRRDRAFIKLNCAALSDTLVESELFGHVEGAFSGATSQRPGRFLTAHEGTLLLDEIGDLPLGTQAKLLRVLQEGSFEAVGSDRTQSVDVRILAATHVDLERAVAEGRFREDLYYRLAVFPLAMPPLRERREDIAVIAEGFLAEHAARSGRGPWSLSQSALRTLEAAPWPGNVRELINRLERATILQPRGTLGLGDEGIGAGPSAHVSSAPAPAEESASFAPLAQVEKDYITKVLRATRGRISGQGGAAEILEMNPSTLQSRLRKLGIDRKQIAAETR